ncbi:MAG: 4Fe-4S dicluster domain-containing protein [Candidatus Dadabacteria bacterium]|nr:MAG: 4Fe-4S dicluster domain-containing protein [Candidatus Dadabacteria bacterium]
MESQSKNNSKEGKKIGKPFNASLRCRACFVSLDAFFRRLSTLIGRYSGVDLNIFSWLGSLSCLNFLIALVTGIILLVWYKPSVHLAYSSVPSLGRSTFLPLFIRSLHRYSSDAFVLLALLHSIRVFCGGKFTGGRYFVWVTGIIALVFGIVDGWLGYWLVWDEKAKQVALASAKLLDVVPVFLEPLSRTFLAEELLHSLLFFLVFFFHMLIPLAVVILFWVHVSRLNAPRFLPPLRTSIFFAAILVLLSILYPAYSAPKASLTAFESQTTVDLFFLFPLYFLQSLTPLQGWLAILGICVFLLLLPKVFLKKKGDSPYVMHSKCTGCEQCFQDCPYGAIQMISSNKKAGKVASISEDKCIQCGICVGSCDPAGIVFPLLKVVDARQNISKWLKHSPFERPFIGFICANSAGMDIEVDPETGICDEIYGYHFLPVTCVGWIHPALFEKARKNGAGGVVVIGCGRDDPFFRLGDSLAEERISGKRHPNLPEKVLEELPIRYYHYGSFSKEELIKKLDDFRSSQRKEEKLRSGPFQKSLSAILMAALIAVVIAGLSDVRKNLPVPNGGSLSLSISLSGKARKADKKVKEAAQAEKLLPHMRALSHKSRERLPIRVMVYLDGTLFHKKDYPPTGIFHDGESLAYERFLVKEGLHKVRVVVLSAPEGGERYTYSNTLKFIKGRNTVVVFDLKNGFRVY